MLCTFTATQDTVPSGITAHLKVFNNCDKVPLNFSSSLTHFQLLVESSGQVTTSSVKLSDFDILGVAQLRLYGLAICGMMLSVNITPYTISSHHTDNW